MRSATKDMPILEHIRELRNILITSLIAYLVACVLAFTFAQQIISLFTEPFMGVTSMVDTTLVVSSIVEGFVAQIRMTFIAGFIISLPVHIFGIIRFIFPALAVREKRILLVFLIVSLIVIVTGAYFVYFMLVPLVVTFLTNEFFVPASVGFILNYQANIFYLLTFILAAVMAFQTPLIMEVLLILNIIKRKQVWKAMRFIIVGIFILSALVTPPDLISLFGVALPLIVFFFLALFIAKIFKFGEG